MYSQAERSNSRNDGSSLVCLKNPWTAVSTLPMVPSASTRNWATSELSLSARKEFRRIKPFSYRGGEYEGWMHICRHWRKLVFYPKCHRLLCTLQSSQGAHTNKTSR